MGIGWAELLIILVIVLVIFGAKRLRTLGSDLGAAIRNFKQAVREEDEKARAEGQEGKPLSEKPKVIEGEVISKEKSKV